MDTTKISSDILTTWLPRLTGAELKVLLAIIYTPTKGDNQGVEEQYNPGPSTITRLCGMTGLAHSSVSNALKALIDQYKLVYAVTAEGVVLDGPAARRSWGQARRPIKYQCAPATLPTTSQVKEMVDGNEISTSTPPKIGRVEEIPEKEKTDIFARPKISQLEEMVDRDNPITTTSPKISQVEKITGMVDADELIVSTTPEIGRVEKAPDNEGTDSFARPKISRVEKIADRNKPIAFTSPKISQVEKNRLDERTNEDLESQSLSQSQSLLKTSQNQRLVKTSLNQSQSLVKTNQDQSQILKLKAIIDENAEPVSLINENVDSDQVVEGISEDQSSTRPKISQLENTVSDDANPTTSSKISRVEELVKSTRPKISQVTDSPLVMDEGSESLLGLDAIPSALPSKRSRKKADQRSMMAAEVLEYLNSVTGRSGHTRFRTAPGVQARLQDGASLADLKLVIDHAVARWGNNEKMREYIRPKTLFGPENFPGYLAAARDWEARGRPSLQNGHQLRNRLDRHGTTDVGEYEAHVLKVGQS